MFENCTILIIWPPCNKDHNKILLLVRYVFFVIISSNMVKFAQLLYQYYPQMPLNNNDHIYKWVLCEPCMPFFFCDDLGEQAVGALW